MGAFERIIFEKDALQYEMGKRILEQAQQQKIETTFLNSNKYPGIRGLTHQEKYFYGKQTMIVGLRKTLKFQTCKPSAHYQLPLVSGCIGQCEYCYLNTQFADRPYVYVYVNIEDILDQANKHIQERQEITVFEGAATSDPIPVEGFSGSLKKTIEFFGEKPLGRFRFVTKYTQIDSLLDIQHNQHTVIRLSVNVPEVIKAYEHRTPTLEKRVEAVNKLVEAGYPVGLIVAPVLLEAGWEVRYGQLMDMLNTTLIQSERPITFEVISHRFTPRAKQSILETYPDTVLPMKEEERKYQYGQFGYGKYVYTPDQLKQMKAFFEDKIGEMRFNHEVQYMI